MTLKELIDLKELCSKKIAELKEPVFQAQANMKEIDDQITAIILEPVKSVRLATGKDTGTVECLVQGVMVKSQTTKVVSWDQEKLAELRERIAQHNDDPDDYMKTKIAYSIDEKKYKDFPGQVKAIFAEARTVKSSNPKVTFDLNWR